MKRPGPKPGDEVVCIDDSGSDGWLKRYSTYRVRGTIWPDMLLTLQCQPTGLTWSFDRFRKISPGFPAPDQLMKALRPVRNYLLKCGVKQRIAEEASDRAVDAIVAMFGESK